MAGVKEKSSLEVFCADLWSKFAFERMIEGTLRVAEGQEAGREAAREQAELRVRQEAQEEVERLNARVDRLKAKRPLAMQAQVLQQTVEPALTVELAIGGSVLLDSHVEKSLSVVQVDR